LRVCVKRKNSKGGMGRKRDMKNNSTGGGKYKEKRLTFKEKSKSRGGGQEYHKTGGPIKTGCAKKRRKLGIT